MKIGITTFGCDGGKSGIGQYATHLLREFARSQHNNSYEVFVHEDEQDHFLSDPAPALNIANALRNPLLNVAWHQFALPGWCKRRDYDVLFLPAGNRRVPISAPCPSVGTVHDFSSLHITGKYDPARMFYITRVLPFLIRRLTRVITVSQSSKEDIVTYAGVPEERVDVIPLGVNHDLFYPRQSEEIEPCRTKYGIQKPYILYVSRIEHPGKNHMRLIKAFEHLKHSENLPHQLVLAGGDRERAHEIHARAEASPFAADIIFTGFLPSEDVPLLYCGAEVLAFPSLYEGFGLPLLESMACGVPVACSNVSSLPEVGKDAAVMFDPENEMDMAETLKNLLTDATLRAHCIQKGLKRSQSFNWSETAKHTLKTLRLACETGP